MKIYYILLFFCLSQQIFSQSCNCPIDGGKVVKGYKNNEAQQIYKGTFLKDNPDITPVDLTIITNNESAVVRSIVNGKVVAVGSELDYIAIIYDDNQVIIYDLMKDVVLKRNDIVEKGTILGEVKLNSFAPKNYKKILNYDGEIYSINLSFYYIDSKTGDMIHNPISIDTITCETIICENCQPKIYGM
ncbi:M23 family metallopeptidase [Chryseobacterium koreense]|uniref:Peptidase M23 domain-containing protein n=1 Tax=Chryseobacterium koreense CCUG 49689 TaxID=1304281 RepID=A0A0J7LMZ1_9FLAO|nr:peptidoglycan DD-metalloendopeptidase family protein [Chryseobacterium koreense]KMQ70460.1 hypothetical protein ACM44_12155 [Chryseobacterium koreense CCUG 49689]MBB5334442.1 hypothetical protein [Chryseobacterium koreense]